MDRTVPKTGSEEIQLYMRTYYSLLRSTDAVKIETLVESHTAMESSLHVDADQINPDVAALIYAALRLPSCVVDVDLVLVGQIEKSFIEAGYSDVSNWRRVFAPGRRRRAHFNGLDTLAVYIVSRSDIDDLVPILTAYQVEWNKLHGLMHNEEVLTFLEKRLNQTIPLTEEDVEFLSQHLMMSLEDVLRLGIVWEGRFIKNLYKIAQSRKQMRLRLISGSLSDYRRGTAYWWRELRDEMLTVGIDLEQHPVYFVSSNTHSLVNLLTGFARRQQDSLVSYIKAFNYESLLAEYREIQLSQPKSQDNFLYFVLKKYLADKGHGAWEELVQDERHVGIHRVSSKQGFEIEAQVIEVNKLHEEWFDPRLSELLDLSFLADSNALILNIDYPLGLAAYELLSRITEGVGHLLGVYIMGKAATLNGRIGDVMIPNVIHDEHSQNTYLFNNCFGASDVTDYMSFGNVLDNQKAITALGTFLQNPGYMSVFYHEGYTDIEMEGGPYLSAIYEAFRPKRHPINEIVNMYGVPFDVGLLHYASDTPMKSGHNLGAGSMNYIGVEPTYAATIAILRRIFTQEMKRMIRVSPQDRTVRA